VSNVKYFRIGKVNEYAEVVGMWELTPDKLPLDHIRYYYDDKGRVIKYERYERDAPKPTYRTYKYDGDTKAIVESDWYDSNGSLRGVHRYFRDERGFMVKRQELTAEKKPLYYIISEYDDNGKLLSETWYDENESIDKKDEFIYNSPESIKPDAEEKYTGEYLDGTFYYKWDERGNLINKEWHDSEDILRTSYSYEYSQDDLLKTLCTHDADGILQMRQVFIHDDCGNVIEEKLYDALGKLYNRIRRPVRK
jgi:hypothetical protein